MTLTPCFNSSTKPKSQEELNPSAIRIEKRRLDDAIAATNRQHDYRRAASDVQDRST
jgi:hypothetical protein